MKEETVLVPPYRHCALRDDDVLHFRSYHI